MGNGYWETPTIAVRRKGEVFHMRPDQVEDSDEILAGGVEEVADAKAVRTKSPDASEAEKKLRAEFGEKTMKDLNEDAERLKVSVKPGMKKPELIELLVAAELADDAAVEATVLDADAANGAGTAGASTPPAE